MSDTSRIFIGLQLSGYLINVIPMIKSTINDNKNSIKWVNGKNLHLTLSFLGDINSKNIDSLKDKLNEISVFNSFDMVVNKTGSFPSEDNPKIIWLDIQEGREELSSIQKQIESIAGPFKENKKEEKFIPHITIGRVKGINKNINLDLSTFSNAVYSDIKIPIKTIYLFRSQLLDKGVEYSILSEYLLK